MLAGLTAGAIAAIVAALVSLPLHSPVDSAFNSATVAVACLVLGLIAGVLWTRMGERPLMVFGALGALFVVVVIVAFVGNSLLDRFLSFVLPLAAIAFVICALLTPILSSYFKRPDLGWKSWAPSTVAVVAALVVGFALITQGDAESGELALPPPPTAAPATAVAPTVAPASTTAPATVVSTTMAPTSTTASRLLPPLPQPGRLPHGSLPRRRIRWRLRLRMSQLLPPLPLRQGMQGSPSSSARVRKSPSLLRKNWAAPPSVSMPSFPAPG